MLIETIRYLIVSCATLMAFCGYMSINSRIKGYDDDFGFYLRLLCIFGIIASILKIIEVIILEGAICLC